MKSAILLRCVKGLVVSYVLSDCILDHILFCLDLRSKKWPYQLLTLQAKKVVLVDIDQFSTILRDTLDGYAVMGLLFSPVLDDVNLSDHLALLQIRNEIVLLFLRRILLEKLIVQHRCSLWISYYIRSIFLFSYFDI